MYLALCRAKLWINFSKIMLVATIIFAWIFSGWPQIWQKPAIPPKIQVAQTAVTNGSIFVVEQSGGTTYFSSDGVSWTTRTTLPLASAVDVTRDANDCLFALLSTGEVYKSCGAGDSWTFMDDAGTETTYDSITSHPTLANYIYVMLSDTGVVKRSEDGGATWITSGAPTADIFVGVAIGRTSAADTTPRLYICDNDGTTYYNSVTFAADAAWTATADTDVGNATDYTDLAGDINGYLYVLDNDGPIVKSTDGMANWAALTNQPTTATNLYARVEQDYYISTDYSSNLYTLQTDGIVSRSLDGGATAWTSQGDVGADTDYVGLSSSPSLPTFNQSAYRLFNNLDSTDVGTALAAQDTAATLGSTGAAFRLRMLLHIGANQLDVSGQTFKLQFAQQSGTCDTDFVDETYADVTAATVIAYNDNATPADDAALTANANDPTHGTDTIVNQTYEELNNFTNSVAVIPSGQDGKWDFSLKDNGAATSTAYCFRAVKSDSTLLDTYTVIPQITTASAAVVSVSVSDGVVTYGTMAAGASKSTLPGELNDMQTATNDGNVTETFNIKGQNTACPWTLAATSGNDQYVHQFCNDTANDCTSPPTNYTALTTGYQTLATGVAQSGTVDIQLRITVPDPSSCFTSQSVDVTIQATQ